MYRSVYCGIEVCIASWSRREMMGLWFGIPTLWVSGRLVRNPASIRRGTLGCVPIPSAPGSRNNIARAAIRRSGSPLLYSPECVEGVSLLKKS